MGKSQTHNHYQNQRGYTQPMSKPSPSSSKDIGITGPGMTKGGAKISNSAPSPMPACGIQKGK